MQWFVGNCKGDSSLVGKVTGPNGVEFDTQSIDAWIRQLVQLFCRNRNRDRHIFCPIVCNCDNIKLFERLRGRHLFEARRLIEVLLYKESRNLRGPQKSGSLHCSLVSLLVNTALLRISDLSDQWLVTIANRLITSSQTDSDESE